MRLALTTDDAYVAHSAAMLRSFFEAHPTPQAQIQVVALHPPEFSQQNRDKLRVFLSHFDAALQCIEIHRHAIARFPLDHFHKSVWYRVLLPELLPAESRILYLDSDLLILDRLDELWDMPLQHHWFAAVANPFFSFTQNRALDIFGFNDASDYLNSGVMLMNLAQMRADDVVQKMASYTSQHPENIYPEQEAFSVIAQGRWHKLAPRWNVQSTMIESDDGHALFGAAAIQEARQNPAIMHFSGPRKPWGDLCRHPWQARYVECRQQTPWPQVQKPPFRLKRFVLKWLGLRGELALKRWRRRLRSRLA